MCFKLAGTGSRVLGQLVLPPGPFSVRPTDSGSYRAEHVFLYLQARLPRPSVARKARSGWRTIRLDTCSGQVSQRIWDGCSIFRFVCATIVCGLTCSVQRNDRWLHLAMEHTLDMLETITSNTQLLLGQTTPSNTRQRVTVNAVACWAQDIDHATRKTCTAQTGMDLPLDLRANSCKQLV